MSGDPMYVSHWFYLPIVNFQRIKFLRILDKFIRRSTPLVSCLLSIQ